MSLSRVIKRELLDAGTGALVHCVFELTAIAIPIPSFRK